MCHIYDNVVNELFFQFNKTLRFFNVLLNLQLNLLLSINLFSV